MAPCPVTVIVVPKKPVRAGLLKFTVAVTVEPGVQAPENEMFPGEMATPGAPATPLAAARPASQETAISRAASRAA